MSATSKIFQVTDTASGSTYDISSDDLLLVIAEGTGSKIHFEDGGNEISVLIVDESPATISSSSQWLVSMTDVTTGDLFYLNADKIVDVLANGTGSDVYVNAPSYANIRKFRATDSPATIRTAIAAIVADASGEFMTLTGSNSASATNTFLGIQTYTNLSSEYTQKNVGAVAGGQADATLLTRRYTEVTNTTAPGDGVRLIAAVAGYVQIVKNAASHPIKIWPATGDSINLLGADTAIDLAVGATREFRALDTAKWEATDEVLSVGDGSVSNPSITFDTNTDTGFYKVSATQTGYAQDGVLTTILDDLGIAPDSTRLRVAVGSNGTGVTAVHYGDGKDITTVLTLTGVTFPIAGAANEAIGKLIYTFPAGIHVHYVTSLSLTLTGGGVVDAATPDVGIGSVIATGAVDVLGGTATFEDYVNGTTWTATCNGTNQKIGPVGATAGVLSGISLNKTGDVKAVHLNMAAAWAGADTVTVAGTVVLRWTIM